MRIASCLVSLRRGGQGAAPEVANWDVPGLAAGPLSPWRQAAALGLYFGQLSSQAPGFRFGSLEWASTARWSAGLRGSGLAGRKIARARAAAWFGAGRWPAAP